MFGSMQMTSRGKFLTAFVSVVGSCIVVQSTSLNACRLFANTCVTANGRPHLVSASGVAVY